MWKKDNQNNNNINDKNENFQNATTTLDHDHSPHTQKHTQNPFQIIYQDRKDK